MNTNLIPAMITHCIKRVQLGIASPEDFELVEKHGDFNRINMIMRSDAIPESILFRIYARSEDARSRCNCLRNKNFPIKDIKEILAKGNFLEMNALSANPSLPENYIDFFVANGSHKNWVAQNTSLLPCHFESLMKGEGIVLRNCLQNKSLPFDVLNKFYKYFEFDDLISLNPSTPLSILKSLAKGKTETKCNVSRHRNSSLHLLNSLARTSPSLVIESVSLSGNIDYDLALFILKKNKDYGVLLASNYNLDPKIMGMIIGNHILSDLQLAVNQALPTDLVMKLLKNSDPQVRNYAWTHPNLNKDVKTIKALLKL